MPVGTKRRSAVKLVHRIRVKDDYAESSARASLYMQSYTFFSLTLFRPSANNLHFPLNPILNSQPYKLDFPVVMISPAYDFSALWADQQACVPIILSGAPYKGPVRGRYR
ncbi:unnamed protein product [Protopolystoma xenopodis]|uniref:Uncharacterized protein n=1 Tax=Protopolystoma xenopodis TaxID=117903 RepID=A0A3S5CQ86_9PLAT|nr:unnamed protein product [Protopolystoma xenopodis]